MTSILEAESVGPVDVAVITFGGDRFDGTAAAAVHELQENGTVRVIDLSFVRKGDDGGVTTIEADDSEVAGRFAGLADEELDLLSDEDLTLIGEQLEPGTAAVVVVWENTWAAKLVSALSSSKGEVAMLQRIPRQVVADALEAVREGERA
ncbi:DUF6325 family protein [Nonomuraea soli]|uniref:DUF1269 domain-containing protein n=1 Tax=Nonomuraea soli TaxID=1032476 RepID=A0A7W0CIZ7_9ACTN|nr:DUF6325 family protein [Nonomuraea soli]MBA2892035.1 hypothetical protein [Nonomuraea soli]